MTRCHDLGHSLYIQPLNETPRHGDILSLAASTDTDGTASGVNVWLGSWHDEPAEAFRWMGGEKQNLLAS